MARDSLRATLDSLQLDPAAAQDRPYLEAMLRRLGYTETEIREELGPALEADAPPAPPADDPLAPPREYRLVVPAKESTFLLSGDDAFRPVGSDSPFEDFERVEFQEAGEPVEFEEVPLAEPAATLHEEPEMEFVEEAEQPAGLADAVEPAGTTDAVFEEEPVEALDADEAGRGVDDVSIDTFGGPDVSAAPKTRVRVKRVRAKSKAEAESKVATANRKVIKSIPVDIVERWGPEGKPEDERKGARK